MYIDLSIIIILLVLVWVFFRKFSSFVYSVAIIDILLRILTFIRDNTVPELKSLIGRIFPESIPHVLSKYTEGTFYTVLMWCYVIIFIIFLVYITTYFIKKRR